MTTKPEIMEANAPPPTRLFRLKSRLALWVLLWVGRRHFGTLQRWGHWAGMLLFYGHGRSRHTVTTNLALTQPDWPPEKLDYSTRQCLVNNCRLSLEMAYLWARPPADGIALIRHIHGEALFHAALADPRGLLLILPHLGNWELTNHYLMRQTPLTALYKPIDLPDVERQVRKARSLGNNLMVPTNQQGVKALIKTLKSGGVSVILPDQSPPLGTGQFAPFFGVPAYTSPLVSRLVAKTKAQCLCIFAHRLPKAAGFDIHIIPADPALFSNDATKALAGLNRSVEQCIAPRIEQYLWTYKRFKLQPNQPFSPYDHPELSQIERTPNAQPSSSPLADEKTKSQTVG